MYHSVVIDRFNRTPTCDGNRQAGGTRRQHIRRMYERRWLDHQQSEVNRRRSCERALLNTTEHLVPTRTSGLWRDGLVLCPGSCSQPEERRTLRVADRLRDELIIVRRSRNAQHCSWKVVTTSIVEQSVVLNCFNGFSKMQLLSTLQFHYCLVLLDYPPYTSIKTSLKLSQLAFCVCYVSTQCYSR